MTGVAIEVAPPKLARPIPPDELTIGKWVCVLYWQSLLSQELHYMMPDSASRGRWEVIDAHVISVGDLVCVHLSNNTILGDTVGAFPMPEGSFLRFVDPGRCFASMDEARRFIQENPGTKK